jgi:predicted dehydrogenase
LQSKTTGSSRVRLAIIGCGAVTELCHLPAAELVSEVEIAALVDTNLARAQLLGNGFGVAMCIDDYRQMPDDVDGVIVALPHHLHAPVTIELLERGMPVLVEKPMALNLKEAEAMVSVANRRRVVLQVGMMNHYCRGVHVVKRAIDENWLGNVNGFNVEWGFVYDWPIASGFFFTKEHAGGGVLIDLGSHVFDTLLWWLGEVRALEYKDDSLGGVEAECALSLTLEGPAGLVQGTVRLSRLRNLTRAARIVGDRFTIECDIGNPVTARMWPTSSAGDDPTFKLDSDVWPPRYAEQLRAFAHAITTGRSPAVSGERVLRSVALIDRCYQERRPLEFSWMKPVIHTQLT